MNHVRPLPTPVQLINEHPASEYLTLPTGSVIFHYREPVRAVYAIQQGLVELTNNQLGGRLRFGAGELFFYEDLLESREQHSSDACAVTPVALVLLDRASFLELIYRGPTIGIYLLGRQYIRLREQRTTAACHFY